MHVVPTSPPWRALAREPMLHFVVLGALLFALDAWRSGADRDGDDARGVVRFADAAPSAPTAPSPRVPIVIDATVQARIAEQAELRLGRRADAAEVAAETERWIDQEVLYREAVARALDRDDPMIHQRVASRMVYVLEQAAIVAEPDEAELRAWFDANRARWSVPARLDFTHVFVAGDDAAARTRLDELAAALARGAAPERLGDHFSGGHRYRGRQVADLEAAFGADFARGLTAQAPGTWQPRRSRFGLHLVRVERAEAARAADLATARLDVRKDWMEARRDAAVAAELARLRAGWEIVRP